MTLKKKVNMFYLKKAKIMLKIFKSNLNQIKENRNNNCFVRIVNEKALLRRTWSNLLNHHQIIQKVKYKFAVALIFWRNNMFKKIFKSLILWRNNKQAKNVVLKNLLTERNFILSQTGK